MSVLSPRAFVLRLRSWVVAAAVLGVLVVLYALLVEQAVLLGVVFLGYLFGIFLAVYAAYLLYRFVDSVSRIADAVEDGRTTPIDTASAADGSPESGAER